MKKRYVFFDLDGTLIDSRGDIAGTLECVVESLGLPVKPVPNALLGAPLYDIVAYLYPSSSNEKLKAILSGFRSNYDSREYSLSYVYPGIYNTIGSLSRHGYELFVATMKPDLPTKRILDQKGLLSMFLAVKSPDSWPGERLEKAEILGRLMSEFNIMSSDAVYVGDQPTDIYAAHKAGIECIAVRYGYGTLEDLKKAMPTAEILAPNELLDLLSCAPGTL